MAEQAMLESQTESSSLRTEISKVERRNAQLEQQLRDANIKVIDFETTTPRTPTSSRDLPPLPPTTPTNNLSTPSRTRSSFLFSSPGSSFRGSQIGSIRGTPEKPSSGDLERRYEVMRRSKEEGERRLEELRELITGQQRTENELNIAKRKAEREATDQRALCLGYV